MQSAEKMCNFCEKWTFYLLYLGHWTVCSNRGLVFLPVTLETLLYNYMYGVAKLNQLPALTGRSLALIQLFLATLLLTTWPGKSSKHIFNCSQLVFIIVIHNCCSECFLQHLSQIPRTSVIRTFGWQILFTTVGVYNCSS